MRLREYMPAFAKARWIVIHAAVGFLLAHAGPAYAQDAFSYTDVSLRKVLVDVGDRTGYHFLYRDALVAGRRIDLDANEQDVLQALEAALNRHGLDLHVDAERHQALVIEIANDEDAASELVVQGVVMDAEHGTRLPFATVTWLDGEYLTGTVANEAGAFRLNVDPPRPLQLNVSYVGYHSRQIRIDPSRPIQHIPVRLNPENAFGPEVVVSTAALYTELDTAWHHLLHAGIFAPLGENGVLRSLQTLPSVSMTTAASAGLNVRGSRADGFQVLLDGISIYNQNHFFGLFDAFNEDVLQTVGLYYGVAPATLQGPPGGTVSFVTRTGSQTGFHGSVGLSNTSGKGTLEGPLFNGSGSWLLSARRSYLNTINWFNKDDLIGLGLNVGRETSPLTIPARDISEQTLITGDASADFFDVHGKAFYEWAGGTRLMLNGYLGGDETFHDAVRLGIAPDSRDVKRMPVRTANQWGNAAAGLRVQTPIGARAFLHSVAGLSLYRSDFSKDDFMYSDPTRTLILPADTSDHVIRPFRNENELLELKLAQDLDVAAGSGTLSAGYALHRFQIDYRETSALHDQSRSRHASTLLDVFAQYAADPSRDVNLLLGTRTHFFALGGFFRLSPRFRVRFFPQRRISVGAGFSRNHQFVHRLYVEPSTIADVWVMSTDGQPPTSVDHVTAGLYVTVSPTLFLQVEGYHKSFQNLREHVASAARRRLRPSSPILDPWLHDNHGLARGLEFMARTSLGPILWTNSYTLSNMEILNPRVNDAVSYPADWDRRHQFASHFRVSLHRRVDVHVVWAYATGTPNALAIAHSREPERLSAYHRMDAGINFSLPVGAGMLDLRAAGFNVYDRSNTWYRSRIPVLSRSPNGRRLGLVSVDVYDLGFQPSFEVRYRF